VFGGIMNHTGADGIASVTFQPRDEPEGAHHGAWREDRGLIVGTALYQSRFSNLLGSVSQVLAPKSASTLWAVHYHELPGYLVTFDLDYDIEHHITLLGRSVLVWTASGSVRVEVEVFEIAPQGQPQTVYEARYTAGGGSMSQTNLDPDHAYTSANDNQDCAGTWVATGPSITSWRYVDYLSNTVRMGWGHNSIERATYSGCPFQSDASKFLTGLPVLISLDVREPQVITFTGTDILDNATGGQGADEMFFTGTATFTVVVEPLGQ
jgi:hypothetical protein